MPFLDHLEELRWRVLWSLLAVVLGFAAGLFVVTSPKVDVIGLLLDPGRELFGGEWLPQALSPTDHFFVLLRVSLWIGLVLASPTIVYQAWSFLAPALERHEKRAIVPALYLGLLLFLGGVAAAYFVVLPVSLRFLIGIGTGFMTEGWTANLYYGFVVKLLLAMGFVFELPVVLLVLSALGLVTPRLLRSKRRHAIVAGAVLASLISPGDMLLATVIMTGSMILLYELGILLSGAGLEEEALRRHGMRNGATMTNGIPPRAVAGFAAPMALAALAGAPATVSGQELSDSLRDVVRSRLERLTRALGDSTDLLPDTLAPDTAAPAAAGDSILGSLLALEGYGLVEYRAEGAVFDPESRLLTLRGSEANRVVMNRDGLELKADSALVFNEGTGRLVTVGEAATFTPEEGDSVRTRQIIFDLNQDRATAMDARTTMGAGAGNWIVRGDCPWVDGDMSYCHRLRFTSCEDEEPHYHFVAREIKITPGGTMVARNVLLYFADVGVFWLPFIAQSTATERRSGLLPVRFSVNDVVRSSDNYSRRVSNIGYYWAISDYADAEVGFDWWSGNYTAVTGALRYEWARQFLQGGVDFRRFQRAEGGSELAVDTRHRWEISERSRAQVSFRYASSSSFVRRNSFDPREVTQSMDSEGGFSRRFDWGNVSVNANRRQFLSDDKVHTTLPTVNLSLSPITLFGAPVNRARFYNNLTWSASGRVSRSVRDLPVQPPDSFRLASADAEEWRGGFSTSLSAGALSVSQSVNLNRDIVRDVPPGFFVPDTAAPQAGLGSVGDLRPPPLHRASAADSLNHRDEELTWSTSVNYQMKLVGSTSLTPQLALSGRSVRSDTLSAGDGGFVAAPRRLSFGARLKADLYGFYYGDRIRHKWSPSFDYAYSPKTEPTDLQKAVFGDRAIQPRNEIRVGMTQTIEMKLSDAAADSAAEREPARARSAGPRRLPRARKVTILGLRTSAVTYDFEKADEAGHFSRGFAENLRISNQISSDYLRGLSVSLEHDVFEPPADGGDAVALVFAPFVSRANLSFSLSNKSALFRWLGRLTGGGAEGEAGSADAGDEGDGSDPTGLETADLGESTVVPRSRARRRSLSGSQRGGGGVGQWSASFAYSLARARGVEEGRNQMLQANTRFQPTEKWSVSWRTSYDLTAAAFNDHVINLKREMHRWEADFAFRQTATGNWTFIFEVALTDNRDLHFDYEQRTGAAPR